MKDFKNLAEDWAEKVLSKQVEIPFEGTAKQLQEFLVLGSLIFDKDGKWLPRLEKNQKFEVKPTQVKNGK